jgi:hypothetical protein
VVVSDLRYYATLPLIALGLGIFFLGVGTNSWLLIAGAIVLLVLLNV